MGRKGVEQINVGIGDWFQSGLGIRDSGFAILTHSMTMRHLALALAALALLSVTADAQKMSVPRLNSEQKKRALGLSKLIDEVFAQKHSAPSDVALSWQGYFVAAEKGLVYVPYALGIDGKLNPAPVAMFVRVFTRDAKPADWDPSKTTTLRSYLGQMSVVNDTRDIRSGYIEPTGIVAEDVHFFVPDRDGRMHRGLWLRPGEYDIFIAVQEKPGKDLPKTAVLKQPVVVPDLSSGLALSSVFVAEKIEPAASGSKPRDQLEDPFAIAGTKIAPLVAPRLRRTDELTIAYYIYNAAAGPSGKPNVEADYIFYSINAGVELPFTKSVPQYFTPETLPADFNPAVHHIMGGEAVSLESFPAGDYRVEVRVEDKVTKAVALGSATFSVFGS
jgi:hypothetical protein